MPRQGFFGFWRTEFVVMRRRIGPILKYSTKGNYCSLVRFHNNNVDNIFVKELQTSCYFHGLVNHQPAAALSRHTHIQPSPDNWLQKGWWFCCNCSRSIDDERKHIRDTVSAAKRFTNSIIREFSISKGIWCCSFPAVMALENIRRPFTGHSTSEENKNRENTKRENMVSIPRILNECNHADIGS